MKEHLFRQNDRTPHSNPLAISLPEIALFIGYFLAVGLIPTSWLDTAVGAIAFAIASKINPYLSEYSIAFQYFIHCHVLATWFFPTLLPYLIIRRNGGRVRYAKTWRELSKRFGGWLPHAIMSLCLFGSIYFSMLWLVDYPLTGSARAIWVSAIAPSALMMQGTLAIGITQLYMVIFSAFTNKEIR